MQVEEYCRIKGFRRQVGVGKTIILLTISILSDTIPHVYSKEEDEYPSWRCKESFRLGERERAADGEYTLELAPKRLFWKAQ
jgi:hypothetical protein